MLSGELLAVLDDAFSSGVQADGQSDSYDKQSEANEEA